MEKFLTKNRVDLFEIILDLKEEKIEF